jgi:exonuclease SbcD
MKISFIADLHLNKSLYKSVSSLESNDLPFRTVDFIRAFEYAVDKNINEIKPDLIVLGGDTYDSFDPSNLVRKAFNSQLKKLSEAKIPIIILIGNHDVCRKHHALEPVKALSIKNIKIVEQPQMVKFKDKILLLFPYSIDIEREIISPKEQLYNFIKESKEKIAANPEMKNLEVLYFGHFGVRGGMINEYNDTYNTDDTEILAEKENSSVLVKSKRNFINNNQKDISIIELDEIGATHVFLGDYHRHQILPTKKCVALYAGSLERTDMSEANQSKGFIVYDSEANSSKTMGKCSFIEYPNCRPMIEFKGNLTQIESQFNRISKENYKGAIVKISFIGNLDELTSFSIGLENFKKQLKEKINPIHIYSKQKTIDAEEQKEIEQANAIEAEILEKGHMSSNDVLDVVNEMIKEKITDQEEQKLILEMSNDIYKSTMEQE